MTTVHVAPIALLTGLTMLVRSQASAAELHIKTLRAWQRYVSVTEARIEKEIDSRGGFLGLDFFSADEALACKQALSRGEVCVSRMQTLDAKGRKVAIPHGMVHHWRGTALVPDISLSELLKWLQDYSKHEERFRDVEASRLLSREGDVFEIFLRLKQNYLVSVHFNSEHVVEYHRPGPGKAWSRSVTTRIAQLENAGEKDERERPPGNDSGFFWRLNSYWRFQEVAEGVIVECESIALSRSIPFAVRWLVSAFTASVPRDTLEKTLQSVRVGSAATAPRGVGGQGVARGNGGRTDRDPSQP